MLVEPHCIAHSGHLEPLGFIPNGLLLMRFINFMYLIDFMRFMRRFGWPWRAALHPEYPRTCLCHAGCKAVRFDTAKLGEHVNRAQE